MLLKLQLNIQEKKMQQLPRFLHDLVGKTIDDAVIVRIVSMNPENDDVQVKMKNDKDEYKIILSLQRVLNTLGYFNEPIKEKIIDKKNKEND